MPVVRCLHPCGNLAVKHEANRLLCGTGFLREAAYVFSAFGEWPGVHAMHAALAIMALFCQIDLGPVDLI